MFTESLSQQTATARPMQLPPCVPMNPNTRTAPRTKAKPTLRETLRKRAHGVSMEAARAAGAEAPYFKIVAYDIDTNVVSIRKNGEAHRVHHVDMNTNRCLGSIVDGRVVPCILQEAIDKLGGQMLAERMMPITYGKCRNIVSELGGDDALFLFQFPDTYIEGSEFIPCEDTIDANRETVEGGN